MSSAILSRIAVRPWGLIEGHLPCSKALRACFTASSTSALSPSATRHSTSSLAGLRVSKVLPDLDGTHLPPIRSFFGPLFRNSSTPLDLAPRAALSTEGVAPIEQSPQKKFVAWSHSLGCPPRKEKTNDRRPAQQRNVNQSRPNEQSVILPAMGAGGYSGSQPPVAFKQTPLIVQYLSVKQRVPDAILFFRLGDFYEMFFEDAEVGARVLDIQLTSRSKDGVPLCGVPYHAAEPYIAKLIKAGHKVAICEQGALDSKARGIMPRQIVRVITPGTIGEETVLIAGEKSYLAAITPDAAEGFAVAVLDVSTGEFLMTRLAHLRALQEELARLAPREILLVGTDPELKPLLEDWSSVTVLQRGGDTLEDRGALTRRFGEEAVGGLDDAMAAAAAAALRYVEENFGRDLAHLNAPLFYRAAAYMMVDETTRQHLELVAASDGSRRGSLLSILDETVTAAGARTLASWITYPLLVLDEIGARHDAIEELFDADLGGTVNDALKQIGDLERLAGRLGAMRASPRDCLRLAQALGAVATLRQWLADRKSAFIHDLAARISPNPGLVQKIDATISEEPPQNPRDGNVIRRGFDAEVDELRGLASGAREVIAKLEASERARTGIPSLKVRYNNVFGYY